MDADDFRDYMLAFLFLKYLSDNYEAAAQRELGDEYPELEPEDRFAPLSFWYADNAGDVPAFETQMRRKVHYVILPEYLWTNIVNMAREHSDDLLTTVEEAFKHIEEDSFESSFAGLFSEINLNSDKLGKTRKARNDQLVKILGKIAKGLAQFSTDSDTLGDAYEYLIGKFAAGSGKKAGEFYTPQPISTSSRPSLRWTARTRLPVPARIWTRCWILPAGQGRCCSMCASASGRTPSVSW